MASGMYDLRLLGSVSLEDPSGSALAGAVQPRPLAVLALLAVARDKGCSRDKLIGYLWPEVEQDRARHRLADAVYLLRKSLGDNAVLAAGDTLRLNSDVVRADVGSFLDALDAGMLEKAASFYEGPFLDGFYASGALEFERWAESERQRLANAYADALEKLAEEAEEEGDGRSVTDWLKQLVVYDPYNSRYVLRLMEALARSGDPANAILIAQDHERLLREELDADPVPDLPAMVERLRRDERAYVHKVGRRSPQATEHAAGSAVKIRSPQSRLLQTLTIYAAVSVGCILVAHVFALQFGLPDWFFRSVIVLLLACLPVVILTTLLAGTQGAKRWLSWRNALALMVAAFALLGVAVSGYMVTRAAGVGPWATLIAKGVLAEHDLIVLAEFEDHTGDPTLAPAVTELFHIKLDQSAVLKVAERDFVAQVLERMERDPYAPLTGDLAREVAIREGLKAVVAGEIHTVGSRFVLSARLIAAETGETLASFGETAGDSDAIISASDRLSGQLRERIGESLNTVRSGPPLSRVRTASLEALRLYTQARMAGERGDGNRAIELLNRAIEIDTTFAAAYRARAGGFQGRAHRIADVKRAYELRDRLPLIERYTNEAAYHRVVTGDFEKAIDAYLTVLELRPDDGGVLNALGSTYRRVGDFARAEEMYRRRIELDSLAVNSWLNLAVTQFNQGSVEEAERTLGHAEEIAPESASLWFTRARFASALGDYGAAEAHIRMRGRLRNSIPRRGSTSRDLARLAQVQGKVAQAESHFRDWMNACEQLDRDYGCTHIAIEHASLQVWLLGDTARALRTIATALERYPMDSIPLPSRPYDVLAGFYAYAGKPERAREILAEWEAVEPDVSPTRGTTSHVYWGAVALAEGRAEEAVIEFRLGFERDPDPCTTCYLPQLASANELAGQPASAMPLYEEYVTTPYDGRVLGGTAPTGGRDAYWLPLVYERLAHLYEQRRDTAKAIYYYGKFAELWKDADPELQPRVEAAQRAIEALSSDT